jgi:N-glycosylase/DNA lyase
MELIKENNNTRLCGHIPFNVGLTLDCGQAFRWEQTGENTYRGIAFRRELTIRDEGDSLLFFNVNENEIREIWTDYFDLNTDHKEIIKRLSGDKFINEAHERFGAIHILRQEPWETLCSFIISACNNIPRIKGIVSRLCEAKGEKTENGFTFPDAKTIAVLSEEELSFLRAGYRVPYILDAARRVAEGEIDFSAIRNMTEENARKELMKIKGVGRKVADCTLLFSLGFTDCYPVDRHIERATKELYPKGLPEFFSPHKGLAQQYIFTSRIK